MWNSIGSKKVLESAKASYILRTIEKALCSEVSLGHSLRIFIDILISGRIEVLLLIELKNSTEFTFQMHIHPFFIGHLTITINKVW